MRAAVEGGDYGSVSEVVRDALRDWRLRREIESLETEGCAAWCRKAPTVGRAWRLIRCLPGARPVRPAADHVSTARRLLLSPRAVTDLEEIADYIARDNPVRAASFVAELEAKCRAIVETPALYPARTDLAPGLRMAVHGRYLVLYRDLPDENTVRVERVLHSARNLPRLL